MLVKTNLQQLYEIDEFQWLEEMIKLLKDHRLDELDLENLIEELEDLSKKERSKVKSLLEQIIIQILLLSFWEQEYERNYRHWQYEILGFRHQLTDELTTNLRNMLTIELPDIYQRAVNRVLKKTGLSPHLFPAKCPYSLEQLLEENWLP